MQNAIKRRLFDKLKQDFEEALLLGKNLLAEAKVVLNKRK
jgi:hypothetical protein